MSRIYRIYSEKKENYAVEAGSVLADLRENLYMENIERLRLLNRYDVEGISEELFGKARNIIFSEPPVDNIFFELPEDGGTVFAVEYLPGQFDQRADSCEQCISLLDPAAKATVRTAKVYILYGDLTEQELVSIKKYLINPVEAREASLSVPATLQTAYHIPTEVETLTGFTALDAEGKKKFLSDFGLAMDADDVDFCQKYFRDTEKRDPTITEIRMIDTYWSDHCRHTTFLTNLEDIKIESSEIRSTYDLYLDIRKELYGDRIGDKPVCLMDLATVAAKKLKKDGYLKELDESEEINACSVNINVETADGSEEWLLMFKNETHNHPTEIEPFGGAATCLGGCIRDPLSGRAYVYQAMRVTGAGDPRKKVSETLRGKLPQRKIVNTAAAGYSSYGNQIGLATGLVDEIYHEGYTAKRLEIGAVVGAAPKDYVVRKRPAPGDSVILLGGRTGRDGCGGATGSSKSHTMSSLTSCGAEVQKGNSPTERKIQRLFRDPEVTRLIKRCNDFGAGGVSVAIGELADGLVIDLDSIPKKYDGLDGTELAISESQERMAVVVDSKDVDRFIRLAASENLEATKVAVVTDTNRLVMEWNGKVIVDISRDFLNTNGASKFADAYVPALPEQDVLKRKAPSSDEEWKALLGDLNVCSKKGLTERFDGSVGASSVLMPYGGKYQLTPAFVMAANLPVKNRDTKTASVMSYGYNPVLSSDNPYLGAHFAVIDSVTKLAAAGCDYKKSWLTFQEYFPRTKNDPARWGLPLSALLGAMKTQLDLKIASIGGKDSMSGTFENIDVPPTLVSFAVSVINSDRLVTGEFKKAGSTVSVIEPGYLENGMVDCDSLKRNFEKLQRLIDDGRVISSYTIGLGGTAEAVAKMSFGNRIGFEFSESYDYSAAGDMLYGSVIVEHEGDIGEKIVGRTIAEQVIKYPGGGLSLADAIKSWTGSLESVMPTAVKNIGGHVEALNYNKACNTAPAVKVLKPRVVIPVFPGTNSEYDSVKAFLDAGADAETFVIKNLSSSMLKESIDALADKIGKSQIIMFPGGFSGGDEPEGSGKFIASFFRNEKIKEAVSELLEKRDGLILGICNGFQALLKLGLLPYGRITELTEDSPTLTFNTIGRHQSMLVNTRIASVNSPWLSKCKVGDIHTVAISHGEGRFIANDEHLARLIENGQIATQYVDPEGRPTMELPYNPNSSVMAVEGLVSTNGRIFGKMGHTERSGVNTFKNVPGEQNKALFRAGVEYFLL